MPTLYKVSTKHLTFTAVECTHFTDSEFHLPNGNRIKRYAKHSSYVESLVEVEAILDEAIQTAHGDALYDVNLRFSQLEQSIAKQIKAARQSTSTL